MPRSVAICRCDDGKNHACCFPSQEDHCQQAKLLEGMVNSIHPQELEEASRQINHILNGIRQQFPGKGELAFLSIPQKESDDTILLLGWVMRGFLLKDSSVEDIEKALQDM